MPTSARALMSVLGFAFALFFPSVACADAQVSNARGTDGGVVILADNGSVHGIGAGTIVAIDGSEVRILTAKHVATFGTLHVRFDDGTQLPAHVLALSAAHDLAVVAAQADPQVAATLHAAPVALPQSHEPVHAWGSGNDGPAFEPAALARVDAPLPDGAPRGRFALACRLCHQGDSGAGIFDVRGELVGVYIGYFDVDAGRVSIAEQPLDAVVSYAVLGNSPKIARSNTSPTPSIVASSGVTPTEMPLRSVASTRTSSAAASASGRSSEIVPAATSAAK
ncbi:MAG: serine protease [Candidatus Eremiobacteraeota bacterium]|nr:serine protease [Candidatus Eremiobacteraeota bacterium]